MLHSLRQGQAKVVGAQEAVRRGRWFPVLVGFGSPAEVISLPSLRFLTFWQQSELQDSRQWNEIPGLQIRSPGPHYIFPVTGLWTRGNTDREPRAMFCQLLGWKTDFERVLQAITRVGRCVCGFRITLRQHYNLYETTPCHMLTDSSSHFTS